MAFGDLTYLQTRVNELLRNDQINSLITTWLNMSQRDLCHYINFPNLKVNLASISSSTSAASYTFTPTSQTILDRLNSVAWSDSTNFVFNKLELIEYDPDFISLYAQGLLNTATLGTPTVASFDESGPTIWLNCYPWAAS